MVISNQENQYLNQLIPKMKSCVTLFLAAAIFVSILIFIILIPIIVNPAISTILANFDSEPVMCTVISYTHKEGISNCSWSSCREGCTNPLVRCHQILVNYSSNYFHDYQKDLEPIRWAYQNAKLFINPAGCGYPPEIQCESFISKYSNRNRFACYYSRTDPEIAVVNFNRSDSIQHLILSLTVPNCVAFFSILILSYFHCPSFFKSLFQLLRKPNK